ncbi:MAG: ATP synthase F1 subunit epsilon [Planctomycetia bacterium]|jgi:F-type H+-transporting ATPase subunit epsilon
MSELNCILVTPETTLRDAPADFVAVELYDGEIGIAPDHSPMIGRLGFGEMRIRSGNHTERYYIEGGFIEVLENTVSILTGRAMLAETLDMEKAQESLEVAKAMPSNTPELMAVRDRAVAQARGQLRVAGRDSS